MLSQSIKRLLARKHVKQLSVIGAPSNINRMYYNDPNTIDELSDYLRERQIRIQKKEELEKQTGTIILNKQDPFGILFATKPPPRISLRADNFPEWWGTKLKKFRVRDQKACKDRQLHLGYDLAAAHFVLYRDGKVKFENQPDWVLPKPYGKLPIPNTYDANYIVEKLDLCGTEIEYEGLLNLIGLTHLKWLSFKDSHTVNDWTIDRISAEYPSLEYLDISGCKGVSERGLEALYRAPNLKTLVVTNHHNSVAFELTCYMLEDVNPHLECVIHTPQKEPHTEEID